MSNDISTVRAVLEAMAAGMMAKQSAVDDGKERDPICQRCELPAEPLEPLVLHDMCEGPIWLHDECFWHLIDDFGEEGDDDDDDKG
jgi:hypothetical protein